MGEHPNAAHVRRMFDAMFSGDMEGAAAGLTDDVEWHEIGRAEALHGKAALREAMMAGAAAYQITPRLHDVVAGDDHVVSLVEATATRGDRTLTYRSAEIFHFRDGKVCERWAFSDDTAAIVAFFA